VHLTRAVLRKCTASRHAIPATIGATNICEELVDPLQQHLPQQEIQKTGLSLQAPSSANSEMIKVATVMQQIVTELRKSVLEKIMVITESGIELNEIKWLIEFIGLSKS
jgi:hypothetical protein